MSATNTRLKPSDPAKEGEYGSYDGSKLFNVGIDLQSEQTQTNLHVAREFCRAEADADLDDVMELMEKGGHYGTFWGIVRGRTSVAVAIAAERKHRIVFTTPLRAITNECFERQGYVQRGDGKLLQAFINKIKRIQLRESIIVNPKSGKVMFRQLHLKAPVGLMNGE